MVEVLQLPRVAGPAGHGTLHTCPHCWRWLRLCPAGRAAQLVEPVNQVLLCLQRALDEVLQLPWVEAS